MFWNPDIFRQNARTFGLNLTIFFPPLKILQLLVGLFLFLSTRNTLSMSCSPFVLVTTWQKFTKKKRKEKAGINFCFFVSKTPQK
jgi:hypothetical protein